MSVPLKAASGSVPRDPGVASRPVTLADVATAARVSAPLVSRVLNGDPRARASEATRERIREAAGRLGYVPNVAARGLRAQRTGLVGLVVHDLSSPIYVELLHGAQAAAAARGAFLVIGDVDALLEDADAYRILVSGRRVDGLVVQGGHGEFDHRIAEIAGSLPTVVVNAPAATEDGVAHVAPDERAATRLLAGHLLGLGHERIGFVSGPRESMTSRLREQGIVEALEGAGLELREDDRVHGDWTAHGGRAALAVLADRWEASGERPTALVAGNALIGVGLHGAAAARGIAVPGELSIACVHDTWINQALSPSLTAVSLPLRVVGEVAVQRLLDGGAPGQIIISDPAPLLHARDSTAPPSAR